MVEDDAITIQSVRLSIEIYLPTISLDATSSGLEALQKLKEGNYDGILVDLGLPDIDGMDLIQKIREFSHLPIVILSARHNPEIISQTMNLGANGYITKPYDCWKLLKLLDNEINKDKPASNN
jgi:two-component system, OmpR family, KDP operon response regulator KdpE